MANATRTCSFEADGVRCEKPRYSRDYCTAHYRQALSGRPLRPLRPYTRRGPECLAGDGCPGKPHSHGYCKTHWQRLERYGRLERVREQYAPGTTCKVEEDGVRCPEPVKAGGYCHVHYTRVRRTGNPGGVGQIAHSRRRSKYAGQTCKAEAGGARCPRVPKALGWCSMHYHRWQRTGDAVGKWGLEPRKSRGYTTTDGYFMAYVDGKKILEHRLVMEQMIGRPLRRFEEPHHKNGIRDDNTPSNLELWVKWRQPNGQRLSDLLDFIAEYYPDEMRARLGLMTAPESFLMTGGASSPARRASGRAAGGEPEGG